ncbi:TPA: hypothetical protein UOJ25_000201 [Stenotrophomonas maltophilia]|nr:hypothetical protein [Stenotrophomonas maltophilia]
MIARLEAWWAAWKWVAILAALCLVLASLNVWQAYRAMTAPMRLENEALSASLRAVTGMAEQRTRDDAKLMADLERIADRGQRVRIEYRSIAAKQPLPEQCAPGQQRVDAINRALSGATNQESSP